MKGRFSAAIISSFGLHALFVLALIFMWQTRPFKIEPPAITVDIVTDANSDAVISSLETKADSTIDSGNPDGNNIPLPPPPAAEPIQHPTQMEAAQPVAKPTPQPTPVPSSAPLKQPAKQLPTPPAPAPMQRATQNQAKPSSKPSSTPFGAEFDISAAMKSASGVDAKGRKAPNLGTSASSVSSSGGKLANDLQAQIKSQMKRCWAEPDGGGAAVTVVVAVKFNQNGSVASTKLISPNGIGANTTQKIAIDNALKAIRDCSPFSLPANRFDEWGHINTMQFNTKQLK